MNPMLDVAINLCEEGSYNEALEILNKFILENPDCVPAYITRADCFMFTQDYESSLKDLEKALKLEPKNIDYLLRKAKVLSTGMQKPDEALKVIKKVLRIYKNSYLAYKEMGHIYLENVKNYKLAVQYFTKAMLYCEDAIERTEIQIFRAKAFMKLNIYKFALWDFDAAEKIIPGDIRLHLGRGYIFADMKRFSEALVEYRKALEIDTLNFDAICSIIEIYCDTGDFSGLVEFCDDILNLDPGNIYVMCEKANAMIMLGYREEAVKFIEEQEIYVDEYLHNYISKRAIIYHKAGCYEKSIEDLEYVNSNILFEGAYNSQFAMNYFCLGKFREAEEYFDMVIRDKWDMTYRTYQYRAECRMELKRFKEAIEDLETAKEMNKDDGEIDFLIGQCYHYLGNMAYAGINMDSSYKKMYGPAGKWLYEMGILN